MLCCSSELSVSLLTSFSIAYQQCDIAGQVDMMKLLVFDYDADLEQNDKTGRTSLHLAANNGHAEAVKILISAGSVINSTTTDGYTALHWACWNGRLEVAILLYEAGADVDCATKFGNTPLHKAIEKKRVQVIKWLVFKGMDAQFRRYQLNNHLIYC